MILLRSFTLPLALLSAPAIAQEPAAALPPVAALLEEAPDFVQRFELDRTQRMTVPVSINGSEAIPFIVDTGAERTVIADDLGKRLALTAGKSVNLVTLTGTSVAQSYIIDSLAMNAIRIEKIEAPALEQRNMGAYGLLGIDSMEGHKLLLDFAGQKMDVLASKKARRTSAVEAGMIVVTAVRRAGRMIISNANIGGMDIDIVIDTGGQSSIGNLALRNKLRQRDRVHDYLPVELRSVTGDTAMGDYTQIRAISIGGFGITNLPVTFTENYIFGRLDLNRKPAILLGMDGLKLFDRVMVDFVNRRVGFALPKGVSGTAAGKRLAMD